MTSCLAAAKQPASASPMPDDAPVISAVGLEEEVEAEVLFLGMVCPCLFNL
jgi:hypothetical protein